jgi:hypothetical protein
MTRLAVPFVARCSVPGFGVELVNLDAGVKPELVATDNASAADARGL